MPSLTRDRRVVVIGAGSNGLVAAIHLARAGLDVTVLEHAPHAGGASSSGEVTLPGFMHDHCAGFNPMTVASPAMQELELEAEGVDWVNPDAIMAHPFDDGQAITLHRDLEATVMSLEAVQPGAGRAWETLVEDYGPAAAALVRTVLGPISPRADPLVMMARLRGQSIDFVRRLLGSVEALGFDIFDRAERPTAWLAGAAQHSGLPPSTAGSGAFGLLLMLVGHSHGWPFPAGSQQSLADALVRIAEREGATLRTGAHVAEIVRSGDRVGGVRLDSGETIAARDVVSSISARPLLAMLGPDALPGRLTTRLSKWRYGTAAFKIDYALSAPVPWSAEGPRAAAVVHVGGELNELAGAAQAGMRGELPEQPALVIGQHTLYDDSRAPHGAHTLYCYAHVPPRYRESDDEVVTRIEAQLERFAPGFERVVRARHVRNPRATEAENPSLVDGDLGGGLMELDQQLIFRPAPEMCRYRTPLAGLYVCGASIHPGGAVHGMSGRSAARALLADRRMRPWRA